MSALVTCRDLECRLGGQLVLGGVDLELHCGESLALLGSSGSGKSTLLRIIAGLEIPEQGEVLIGNQPATRDGRLLIPPHRRGIAMLFQDLALWPNLTVEGNILLGLEGLRLPRQAARERVIELLRTCGIEALADRLPGTLSGGQQQRVALARALAVRPELLLLDEPFGGLDLVTKESVIQEIAKLKTQFRFALILVSHDPAEVRAVCTSLAVLEGGRVADRVCLGEDRSNPRSPLARVFIKQWQALTRGELSVSAAPD